MARKRTIILAIVIPLILIIAGFGGFFLYKTWPATWTKDPPEMIIPIANLNVIDIIWGYGYHGADFHNGIDYGCNESVEVLAWCKLRVLNIRTWFNDGGGHWQTNIQFSYNWQITFDVGFESWALNETYANLQKEALDVKVNQILEQGDKIGSLIYHGSGTHIHFGMKIKSEDVCAYQYLSEDAKLVFDNLWNQYGYGDDSWYN